MQIEMPQNIIIGGKEYSIGEFSDNVRKLVSIHTEWRSDLAKERLALAKTEAAIKALDAELSQLVTSELQLKNPKPEPEELSNSEVSLEQENN